VVDVAHASTATLEDVAAMTAKPLIDSYNGPHPKTNAAGDKRLRTWAEMALIVQTGGVVCLWPLAYAKASGTRQTFADWAAEILAMKQNFGIEHVGLGTDGDVNLPARIIGYAGIGDLGSLAEPCWTPG
jgi:microsomal dipeptidase-like Zn-dependent dipeptidase